MYGYFFRIRGFTRVSWEVYPTFSAFQWAFGPLGPFEFIRFDQTQPSKGCPLAIFGYVLVFANNASRGLTGLVFTHQRSISNYISMLRAVLQSNYRPRRRNFDHEEHFGCIRPSQSLGITRQQNHSGEPEDCVSAGPIPRTRFTRERGPL